MSQFESLTKYIPSIPEDDIGTWVIDRENDGTMEHPTHFPFVNYSEMVDQFVEDVYSFSNEHPEFGLNRYGEILEKNGIEWGSKSMSAADVSDKDAQCVLALILGAVRAERFCDGALMGFFKDGSVRTWLTKLLEMDKCNNIKELENEC